VTSTASTKKYIPPESRRAIAAPSDVLYGLGRMFEILRENAGETGIRVFRDLDERSTGFFPRHDRLSGKRGGMSRPGTLQTSFAHAVFDFSWAILPPRDCRRLLVQDGRLAGSCGPEVRHCNE